MKDSYKGYRVGDRVRMLDCTDPYAPIASGSMKVAVRGPDATPPESKAMAVYISGTKKDSTIAII